MREEKEARLAASEKAISPLVATVMIISSAIALIAVVVAMAFALKTSPVVGIAMLFTFTIAIGAIIITIALALEAPR